MKNLKEKKYRILSILLKYSFVIVLFFIFIFPISFNIVNGETNTGPGGGTNTGPEITTGIENPVPWDTLQDFLKAIITVALYIGVPIITLAIIYSGFLFVQAQGKPDAIKKAKSAFMYTLIGAALLLGAYVIAEAIVKTVEEFKS